MEEREVIAIESGRGAGYIATVCSNFARILPEMTPTRPPHDPVALDTTRGRVRRLEARHYVWVGVTAFVVVLLLHWLGPILTPFLVGAILAYVGRPAVDWAAAHGVPRTLGTLLVILFMAILLIAL